MWTSKSGPRVWCFPHFDLQICFAPQRRAIFEHRNFQNGSAHVVFCAFRLTNMLRATAACHFWTSQLPKWLRPCGVFVHFDWQICFAPQRRAIFEHRNVQNGSGIVVFCAFWLANVLFATAACHFSPVRGTVTSAPAALASLTFRTSGTTIHWENTAIRDFTNIFRAPCTACERLYAHVDLLASDLTDVDLLATDMTAVRLCFSTLHIVGS